MHSRNSRHSLTRAALDMKDQLVKSHDRGRFLCLKQWGTVFRHNSDEAVSRDRMAWDVGPWRACAPGWPDCSVEGSVRGREEHVRPDLALAFAQRKCRFGPRAKSIPPPSTSRTRRSRCRGMSDTALPTSALCTACCCLGRAVERSRLWTCGFSITSGDYSTAWSIQLAALPCLGSAVACSRNPRCTCGPLRDSTRVAATVYLPSLSGASLGKLPDDGETQWKSPLSGTALAKTGHY